VKSEVESIEDAVSSMEVDDGEKKKKKKKKKTVSWEFIRSEMFYECRFYLAMPINIKFI
jgi:hypothetical protein